MSGGSHGYLCYKDAAELLGYSCGEYLQLMADDLAKLGYASDAAKETQQLLLTVRAMRNRIETMAERLHDVWRALELWESGDYSEDGFRETLALYRGETGARG